MYLKGQIVPTYRKHSINTKYEKPRMIKFITLVLLNPIIKRSFKNITKVDLEYLNSFILTGTSRQFKGSE